MTARYAIRFITALVLGALASAAPAWAHDRYDAESEHYLRDRHQAQHHRSYDRRESFGQPLK